MKYPVLISIFILFKKHIHITLPLRSPPCLSEGTSSSWRRVSTFIFAKKGKRKREEKGKKRKKKRVGDGGANRSLRQTPRHPKKETNYFTSSDPHRDIILKHIRHKFWHSFCPSVSRFNQNYPLLLVPSPGSGSSSDHCYLSSQTDSNWLSLCLIQNNFRRLGPWKLRFERYKTIWLS